jgi:uncharacterized Zn-finger protein
MIAQLKVPAARPIEAWEWEGGALARRAPRVAATTRSARSWMVNTSRRDARAPVAVFGERAASMAAELGTARGYPKFKNDLGVREIRIGAREFECIGAAPPHDHPHVHIDMGSQDTILCPYCATRYRMDPEVRGVQADPPDSMFADADAAPRPPHH